ncbi:MAG: hypothetical protein QG603_759 [Patescibacteria group bacterium]|nr:hypothetical protein [Patescibacteria group bacterium]
MKLASFHKKLLYLKKKNLGVFLTGFTLIEVLLVVAIMLILLSSGASLLGSRTQESALDTSAKAVVDHIAKARNYAVTGYQADAWGVKVLDNDASCFEGGDCIVVFKGDDYATRDSAYDSMFDLKNGIAWTSNEQNEFYFSMVAGWLSSGSSVLGDQYLSLSNNVEQSITILISSNGLVSLWACGDTVLLNSLSYGTVEASDGNCWLDRNIGASRVAQSFDDAFSYGYLYQWGRASDGHQLTSSDITATLSAFDTPGHSDFITPALTPFDWRSSQNNDLWQGVLGTNNVCPSGFRLPTRAEWTTLLTVENITNSASAYSSALRLTVNGYRDRVTGILTQQGNEANYWSSTVSGNDALVLWFTGAGVGTAGDAGARSYGMGVRCVKN